MKFHYKVVQILNEKGKAKTLIKDTSDPKIISEFLQKSEDYVNNYSIRLAEFNPILDQANAKRPVLFDFTYPYEVYIWHKRE